MLDYREGESERTGMCKNEVDGQVQVETSAVAITVREFPGTDIKAD